MNSSTSSIKTSPKQKSLESPSSKRSISIPDPNWQELKQRFSKIESFQTRLSELSKKQEMLKPPDTIENIVPVAVDDMTTYATLSKEVHMHDEVWNELIKDAVQLCDDIKESFNK